MAKVKIISEYENYSFSNNLADSLTANIEYWISTKNPNIISIKTDVHSVKDNTNETVFIMTASIIYE